MPEGRGGARLFVLAGPDLARSFALGERSTVGRSDECDVVLRDRSISRKHALVVREAERWFVQDLGSTNGVTKDGRRGERFELADGDEFRLGDLPLRFKLSEEGEAQDIEFDLAPAAGSKPPAPVRPPAPAPAPPPRVEPAAEAAEEVEIEIEGPDAPLRPAPSPLAATAFRAPRAERRTGFLAGDVEQQPFWMRCLVFLGLLAASAGLAWGAYVAVQMLRAGT
jgi:predicted component of type VI protein secretion system